MGLIDVGIADLAIVMRKMLRHSWNLPLRLSFISLIVFIQCDQGRRVKPGVTNFDLALEHGCGMFPAMRRAICGISLRIKGINRYV